MEKMKTKAYRSKNCQSENKIPTSVETPNQTNRVRKNIIQFGIKRKRKRGVINDGPFTSYEERRKDPLQCRRNLV